MYSRDDGVKKLNDEDGFYDRAMREHKMARRALILDCKVRAQDMSSWRLLWERGWWLEFASGTERSLASKAIFGTCLHK